MTSAAVPPVPASGWPQTALARAGPTVLAVAMVWLIAKGQYETAGMVLGVICWMLGMDARQAAAIGFSFRAAVNSASASEHASEAKGIAEIAAESASTAAHRATHAAETAASSAEMIKAGIRNIQDNPAGGGTAGWMDRHDPKPRT